MSIKTRLVLSYMAMTFIPVVLFALIAIPLATLLSQNMSEEGEQKGMSSYWATSDDRDELLAAIKFMARIEPDRFADSDFLKATDEQLSEAQAALVVMIHNQITFASPTVDNPDLYNQLQGTEAKPEKHKWSKVKINDRYTMVKYELILNDGRTGMVYLLSDQTQFFHNARKFFPLLLMTLLIVVGLTNGILTYLVSRSLIKPLYALRHAAVQIREGDLAHEVNLNRKDEIGELGAAFEAMRVRLNESIRLQLQYEENRKELISNISHDLKTPITGIKACVEGLQDGIADTGPKRDKYIGMIAKKTEEMDRLIDELFLFSKLDLKRLPFDLETTDLAAYMRDSVEELRLDPRLEGVSIAFSYTGGEPVPVTADREKLHRVIMNIISNSLKYMNKAQKEIRIELIDNQKEATIMIRDNGAGIEDAALPHIFDRFYRAELSRNTATGGSGLGLAIVKQIVEGQGGHVWAESRIEEGTSIYFTLRKSEYGGEST